MSSMLCRNFTKRCQHRTLSYRTLY